jgi:hypothetical protein
MPFCPKTYVAPKTTGRHKVTDEQDADRFLSPHKSPRIYYGRNSKLLSKPIVPVEAGDSRVEGDLRPLTLPGDERADP